MHIAAILGIGAATNGCAASGFKTPAQVSLKDIYDFKATGNI